MSELVRLKKYANRRLYDMEKSKYVTLDQVAGLIKKGRQVKIVDAKTKEDVTAFILTQIVLEEARSKKFLLPAPVLHLIIQYGDNILGEFFERYLQQMIQVYLTHKQAVNDKFKKWLEMGLDLSNMTQKTITGFTPFFNPFSSPSNKEEKSED